MCQAIESAPQISTDQDETGSRRKEKKEGRRDEERGGRVEWTYSVYWVEARVVEKSRGCSEILVVRPRSSRAAPTIVSAEHYLCYSHHSYF